MCRYMPSHFFRTRVTHTQELASQLTWKTAPRLSHLASYADLALELVKQVSIQKSTERACPFFPHVLITVTQIYI